MEVYFSRCAKLPNFHISNAVKGIQADGDIRDLLFDTGIQSFRQMAGYIPRVMSIENEPKPILKDWRSCPFRTYFSEYHFRWIASAFDDLSTGTDGAFWWRYIPWSKAHAYPQCCHLSSNDCGLSRRNRLTVD